MKDSVSLHILSNLSALEGQPVPAARRVHAARLAAVTATLQAARAGALRSRQPAAWRSMMLALVVKSPSSIKSCKGSSARIYFLKINTTTSATGGAWINASA